MKNLPLERGLLSFPSGLVAQRCSVVQECNANYNLETHATMKQPEINIALIHCDGFSAR